MIAAHTPADVRAAVLTARARGQRVAVRATGHGTFAEPSPDTLVVDTSSMRSVLVDPDRGTARVGPGATAADVVAAAAPFGLAPVTGTHGTVGLTGFTLGGGHGSSRAATGSPPTTCCGRTSSAPTVSVFTARADRRSELFWALGGAGGNFGVATSLEVQLHPVRELFGGVARFDRGLAPHLAAALRRVLQPDALNVSIVVEREAVAVRGVYVGGADDAWRALAPLFLDEPLSDAFRLMPYAGDVHDRRHARRGTSSCCVTCRWTRCCRPPSARTRSRSSAGRRDRARDPPAGHRSVPFSVTVDGDDLGALGAHVTGGTFLNFSKDPARTHDAYTRANRNRLLELKHAYDPRERVRRRPRAGHPEAVRELVA